MTDVLRGSQADGSYRLAVHKQAAEYTSWYVVKQKV